MTSQVSQYRIELVQVLNWGGYCGLHSLPADRLGAAIVGPSGRGKSTLLDAIASVIFPNPQEFNRAARDDRGRKQERTVYSYVRGMTAKFQDRNRRSSTAAYLRPPSAGGNGFASGAAVTWCDDEGRRVTAFRLAWISPDATDNADIATNTVYGFLRGLFDYGSLDGLVPARAGAAPVSVSSLQQLLPTYEGVVLDSSQAAMHAAMRREMGMGDTEEAQRFALRLLRRAQSAKGIYTIDELFKEEVLTRPMALDRWDVALAHYTEATKLYQAFQLARTKMEAVAGLPGTIDRYRRTGSDASVKRSLLGQGEQDPCARLWLWYAGQLSEWSTGKEQDVRLDRALAEDQLQAARSTSILAKERYDSALDAITAAGGDLATLLRSQLGDAERSREQVRVRRRHFADRLAPFNQVVPSSAGDLTLLHGSLEHLQTAEDDTRSSLEAAQERALQIRGETATRRNQVDEELRRLRKTASNIPPSDDAVRKLIARGVGLPADRLRFVGELMDIDATHHGWERAIVSIIRPLAQDLVVDDGDFAAVRGWVNDHDIQGRITLAKAQPGMPTIHHTSGTVAAMVQVAPGPHAGWISHQLQRFTYLCVERDTDLDQAIPTGIVGAVTRAGMRTGRAGRVVKDDTRNPYRWIGRDNTDLQATLVDEQTGLDQQLKQLTRQLDELRRAVAASVDRSQELRQLRTQLIWAELDEKPTERQIADLTEQLEATDTTENKARRDALETCRQQLSNADEAVTSCQQDVAALSALWAAVCQLKDTSTQIVERFTEPLLEDELAAAEELPFDPPDLATLRLTGDRADETRVAAAMQAGYRKLVTMLQQQIRSLDELRAAHEKELLMFLRSYRAIDERTRAEVDEDLGAVPALEAIHRQLVLDDLPRARRDWLHKVNRDLTEELHALLTHIEADKAKIISGIKPINRVLAGVPFREGSQLAIEPVEATREELTTFRAEVQRFTRDNPLGGDLFTDEDTVERSFSRLQRHLSRISDQSKAGGNWRKHVFDAREQLQFQAIETLPDGRTKVHEGVAGMSGGEGQELIAFILGAALRYRLGEDGGAEPPRYASVILDEGFVKADSDFTGRAVGALQALGFQLLVAAPRENTSQFEGYVDWVAYINTDPDNPPGVRIYPMPIEEALQLEEEGVT